MSTTSYYTIKKYKKSFILGYYHKQVGMAR